MLGIAIRTVLKTRPSRIVVNAHHLQEKITEYINSHDFGVEIIVIREEGRILGTAGGIKNAEPYLRGSDFAVLNSDVIMDPPWEMMKAVHRSRRALATLALRANPDPARYGVLCVDGEEMVTRYLDARAPGHDEDAEPFMFTGASIVSPAIFDLIPPGRPVDISGEVYKPLVSKGGALFGVNSFSSWLDLGTTADYHKTVMEAFRDMTSSVVESRIPTSVRLEHPVYIERGAVIGDGAVIGPNVAIHKGAVVGAGARLANCVVLPDSVVEKDMKKNGP